MTTEEFEDILEERLFQIRRTLSAKAAEYATDDRLHNFKVAARVNNTTPARALWGMFTKHLVSVIDMVEGRIEPTDKLVDEKVGDMINYLILLEAVLKEGHDIP